MSTLDEEDFYEPTIDEFDTQDFVQGSPVEVAGQDYDIVDDEVQLATYLKTVTVKLAGGAGGALVEDTDYSVQLRTGVVTALPGGALDGQAEAWIEYTKSGTDDIPHRQLANRLTAVKSDLDEAIDDIAFLEAVLGGLEFVPLTREIETSGALSGGGDLSSDLSLSLVLDGASLTQSGAGLKIGVQPVVTSGEPGAAPAFAASPNGFGLELVAGAPAWVAQLKCDVQSWTTDGSYTKPAGTIRAQLVVLIGQGGGGGGGHWRSAGRAWGGGGGSSGQRIARWFFGGVIEDGAGITIGDAAGQGGAGSSAAEVAPSAAVDGEDTTLAFTGFSLVAKGGQKGAPGSGSGSSPWGGQVKLPADTSSNEPALTAESLVALATALYMTGHAARGGGGQASAQPARAGESLGLPGGAPGTSSSGYGASTGAAGGNGGGGGHQSDAVSGGDGGNATGSGGTPATGGQGGTGYGAGGGGGAGGSVDMTTTGVGGGGNGAPGYALILTLYSPT